MGVVSIRRAIATAEQVERNNHALEGALRKRLPTLQASLLLPKNDPVGALLEFCRRYIESVPDFLQRIQQNSAVSPACARALSPLLHMAEDFFLAPPEALADQAGLKALMDEAFLAQRLIEEVDERYQRSGAGRLLAVDMTRANIIALHLIGEPLASRLESLVRHSLELVTPPLSAGALSEPIMMAASIPMPCMSREVGVDLRLPLMLPRLNPHSLGAAGG